MQSGDRVHLRGSGAPSLELGSELGSGPYASVFALVQPDTEAAKIYSSPERCPDLHLLGRHLNRALGDVTDPSPGGPLVARPTYELFELPSSQKTIGFVMHRFGEAKGWMSLLEAGDIPQLGGSPEWCLEVAQKIAADVAYMHARRLIIGDLSDTNIRVTKQGDVSWIDVDSFGALRSGELAELKASGSTPECRAPELIAGQAHGTLETDRFALALQLLRLLTCRFAHPFAVERRNSAEQRTVEDRVEDHDSWMVDPKQFKAGAVGHQGIPGLPRTVAVLALRALDKDPSTRPEASEWVTALKEINAKGLRKGLAKSVVAPPPAVVVTPPPKINVPTPARAPRKSGGGRIAAVVLLGVFALIAVVVGLVIAASGGDAGATSSTSRTTSTTAAVSTTSENPPPQPSTTTEAAAPPSGPSAAQRALTAATPSGMSGCLFVASSAPGVRAAQTCHHVNVGAVTYLLFRSIYGLDRHFGGRARLHGAPRSRGDCPNDLPSSNTWYLDPTPKVVRGRLLCYRSGNVAHIAWSFRSKHLFIEIIRRDGDMRKLYRSWASGNFNPPL